jgi:hypothetical protein
MTAYLREPLQWRPTSESPSNGEAGWSQQQASQPSCAASYEAPFQALTATYNNKLEQQVLLPYLNFFINRRSCVADPDPEPNTDSSDL